MVLAQDDDLGLEALGQTAAGELPAIFRARRADDILTVLTSWGECPQCPADLNDDGVVNFDDLLIVLSNWTG